MNFVSTIDKYTWALESSYLFPDPISSTLLYYIDSHFYIEVAFFIRSDSDPELALTYVIIKYIKQRQTRQFKDIGRDLDPIKNLLWHTDCWLFNGFLFFFFLFSCSFFFLSFLFRRCLKIISNVWNLRIFSFYFSILIFYFNSNRLKVISLLACMTIVLVIVRWQKIAIS